MALRPATLSMLGVGTTSGSYLDTKSHDGVAALHFRSFIVVAEEVY